MKIQKQLVQLDQKIKALQEEKQKIESELFKPVQQVLEQHDAFHCDMDSLCGGLLFVLNAMHNQSPEVAGWAQNGKRFRRQYKTQTKDMESYTTHPQSAIINTHDDSSSTKKE